MADPGGAHGLNALARTDRLGLDWTTRGVWFGLWRTLLPHVLIGWGGVWRGSLLLFKGLGYPMQGSWLVLTAGLGLASAACVTMGLSSRHHPGSGAGALWPAPTRRRDFAFMGVTFPVSAMGDVAQFWRSKACCPSPTMWSCRSGKPLWSTVDGGPAPARGSAAVLLPLLLVVHRYRTPSGAALPMRSPGHDGILGSGAP